PDLKSDLSERDIAMKLQELRDSSPSVYARITKQAEDKKLLSERKIQLSTAGQKADWIAIFIKASLPNSPEIKEKIKNQAIAKGLIIEGKIGSPTPESIEAWRKIFNDNMPRSLCSADDMTDALYRLKQPSPEKHTALIEAAKASGLMTDEVMHFKNKLPQWNALLDIFLSDTSAVSFAKKLMERLRQHVSALVSLIDDPAKKIMPSEFDLFKGYHALLDVAFKESPLLSTGSIRAEIERSGHDYTWRHIIHYLHQTLNDPDHRF
ncbi:MAG: hypothetical protein K9M13_02995, partial [Simkaniaceae bacterium]|nr:hypothetical protein [Simkaniaceae bacterium]